MSVPKGGRLAKGVTVVGDQLLIVDAKNYTTFDLVDDTQYQVTFEDLPKVVYAIRQDSGVWVVRKFENGAFFEVWHSTGGAGEHIISDYDLTVWVVEWYDCNGVIMNKQLVSSGEGAKYGD